MNYENEEELALIDTQLIITIVVIVAVIISAAIGYNIHLRFTGQKTFWTEEETRKMGLFVKIIILVAATISFCLTIWNRNIVKKKGENTKCSNMEIGAAFLVVVSALIFLYTTMKNLNDFFEIENPNI